MSKDRQLIIVEARPESLRLNFLRGDGASVIECVGATAIAPTDPKSEESSLLDQLALDAATEAIRDRTDFRNADMVVIVGGGDIACHYFAMPQLEGATLLDAVRLKLGQQMHFPLDEAVIDITRLPGAAGHAGETIPVRATAVRKVVAEAAVAFAQQARRHLVAITSSAIALTRLTETTATDDGVAVCATLQIDASYSTLIVVGESGPCLTTELPVGADDFTRALMRPIIAGDDVFQIDEAQAIELRNRVGIPDREAEIGLHNLKGKSLLPLLEPAIQRFAQQLTQWLTFAATTEGGGQVQRLQVVGQGALLPGLGDALSQRLKIDFVLPNWLESHARVANAPSHDLESYAAASAAMKFLDDLPVLLPDEERKRRRIARFRSSTTKAGPIIAAATLGIAFLFNQVGGHLSQAVGEVQSEMLRVQSLVDENTRLHQERAAIDALKGRFDLFSSQTPNWLGLFKELSIILPMEIRVRRLRTGNDGGELRVIIDGDVARSGRGQSYDESVELALTALERSPFAKSVRLMNSSRKDGDRTEYEGTMSVEVSLAYKTPPKMEQ